MTIGAGIALSTAVASCSEPLPRDYALSVQIAQDAVDGKTY